MTDRKFLLVYLSLGAVVSRELSEKGLGKEQPCDLMRSTDKTEEGSLKFLLDTPNGICVFAYGEIEPDEKSIDGATLYRANEFVRIGISGFNTAAEWVNQVPPSKIKETYDQLLIYCTKIGVWNKVGIKAH